MTDRHTRGWEISVEDLEASLREDKPPRVIDCREEDEWQFCRIEGAQLLPLSSFGERFAKVLPEPSEDIIIYCHHGMRSMQATSFLRSRGYESVFSLAGGIEAWSLQGHPEVARY